MWLVLLFYVVMKVLHRKHFVIIIILAWIPKAGILILGLFCSDVLYFNFSTECEMLAYFGFNNKSLL